MQVEVGVIAIKIGEGVVEYGYPVEAAGRYFGEIEERDGNFFFIPWNDLCGEPAVDLEQQIKVRGFKEEWDEEQTRAALQMIMNSSIGKKVLTLAVA